jgi:Gametolysin peptidase M11
MNSRPWTSTRRLYAGLRMAAVSALILSAPLLLPSRTAFAHEAPRSTASTATPPSAGDNVELEGTLEILHEDWEDGGRFHYFLTTPGGKRLTVDGVPSGHDLLTGDRVRVKGRQSGKAIWLEQSSKAGPSNAVSNASLEVLAAPPMSNTFGVQKVVVLLVNFSNDPRQPYSVAQARTKYADVDSFYRENSYGQTSLDVEVFGWYTLPVSNATCNISQMQTYARQAATAAGVNLSNYTRQVYAFPQTASCGFSGIGTVGGNPSSAWINANTMSLKIISHELGHNFGLYHSHALKCSPDVLSTSCTVIEYGDITDAMGGLGHFNAFQKQRLGWLEYANSPPITTAQTSGTYTIDAYETPGSVPKAVRIPRGNGQSFFVELRRNLGWDADMYRSGIFVHLTTDSDPNSSYLLDMAPQTSSFSADAFLDVGQSFADPYSPVSITTVSVSDTSATVMINMGATCTRAAPRITASPDRSIDVLPGTSVTYSLSVTNTDSPECPPSSFAVQATTPIGGWQTTLGASNVAISPGATVWTMLRVSSPAVAPGPYTIGSSVINSTTSSLSGATSVVYSVASTTAPPVTPATFTDGFDRPDSATLGNGWAAVAGSLMVQSGEARNTANATPNVAVQPGLIGPTQTVTTSFASTNNNTGPKFSVLMRPAANSLFTLSCQASDTTLALAVGGVSKLSTTDSTFSTGSAGFAMSSQKLGAHRADNFSANVK